MLPVIAAHIIPISSVCFAISLTVLMITSQLRLIVVFGTNGSWPELGVHSPGGSVVSTCHFV